MTRPSAPPAATPDRPALPLTLEGTALDRRIRRQRRADDLDPSLAHELEWVLARRPPRPSAAASHGPGARASPAGGLNEDDEKRKERVLPLSAAPGHADRSPLRVDTAELEAPTAPCAQASLSPGRIDPSELLAQALCAPLHAASLVGAWLVGADGPTPLHYVLYRLCVRTLADLACLEDDEVRDEPLGEELLRRRLQVRSAMLRGALPVPLHAPIHTVLTRLPRAVRRYLQLRRLGTVGQLFAAAHGGGLFKPRRGCPLALWTPVQTLCIALGVLPPESAAPGPGVTASRPRAPRQRLARRAHRPAPGLAPPAPRSGGSRRREATIGELLGLPAETADRLLLTLYDLLPADGRPLTAHYILARVRQTQPELAALLTAPCERARRLFSALRQDDRFRCESGGLVARHLGVGQLGLGEQLVVRVLAALGPQSRTSLRHELFRRYRYYACDDHVLGVLERAEALGLIRRVERGRYQALCRPAARRPPPALAQDPPRPIDDPRGGAWRQGGPILW